MAPRSRASDSLLGCFVWRLAPMSARPDDAPDNCERSQRLHQASSGREAVPECKLHGGLPVRSAPRRKRPGLRCRGSHPRRLAGGSQYALLTPQNLARVPALGDMPPRHLPLLPVRIIRPGGSVPIRSPSVSQGLHAFSPLDGSGAVPLRIGPTTGQITAIYLVRHEQAPKATAGSPPAVGSGRQAESTETPARRSKTRAGRARHTAPNPGTSWRGALGGDSRPEERSEGERTGPELPVNTRGGPRTDARAGCRRRARRGAEDACAPAMKELSTGTY
jgi:hypothetical protein